jgi:uncharacterized protein YcaQ
MRVSLAQAAARRIALEAAGLLRPAPRGIEGARSAIERLGSLQIDTISVVERAHHHVLWSRVRGYRNDMLDRLEAEPRRVFEYWSHAAAYLPIGEYRFCLPRMKRIKAEGHQWFKADPKAVAYVRDKVRSEGPLRTQDFKEPLKGPRGWWDWKPAKVALEYLFHAGELVSIRREGFQKVYELAERALPADLDRRFPSEARQAARHVDRAIASLGLFLPRDVAYMRKDGVSGIPAELAARIASGALVELEVEPSSSGARSQLLLASPAAIEAASEGLSRGGRALVLSPFDPLIIDRRRASRLFGLDYQLECYVPEAKRAFGYFALPILYLDGAGGSGFVALLDAKAERGSGLLAARRLALLPSRNSAWAGRRRPGAIALAGAIAAELRRFAAFNGAERVELGLVEAEDARFGPALRSALKASGRRA